ncbi:MAG: ATP-binding cassette domain-containing protein [Bacilli bacterium]|nr:ATP-binding cassette domain-containing protein [Bacilli bacterium]
MNSTKLLQVNNLSKTFYTKKDELKVIDNISFDVFEKDIVALIGPSGCGKSSILNIISNLDKQYKGTISKKENIKIAYMFQEDTLFDWLTIYENAVFNLKLTKNLTKENIEYVNNLLRKYKLYEFKDNYPNTLSGGMKQRLSLIRTLSLKPNILLLDEPFCALDYQTKLKIITDVYNIIKEEKITAIIVTHDIEEAISLCNKIIVLTNRPTKIKHTHIIKINENPLTIRNTKEFSYYHNLIWEEIEKNV